MTTATSALTAFNEPCPSKEAGRIASGAKPTILLMSGRTMAFAATFFVPVVLARVLSQAEFGTYKQLFLLFGTLYYIAQLGMAESLFYFLPAASREAGRYVANAILFLTVAGLGCVILLHEAGPTLAVWLNNPELANYTTSLGAFLGLMLASSVLEITMVARGKYLLASTCYGVSDLLRALCFVVPALMFRRIDVLLFGAVAFAAARLVGTLVYLARTFDGDLRPQTSALRRQLRYTVPFGIATVLEICQANLHLYAVSYYADAATFAIYAVGCLQIPIVDLVASSAGSVIMVRMAEGVREGRKGECLAIWRETVRHLALVLVPVVGLLLVTAHLVIVLLFTDQYASAVPIFTIWSLAILPGVFLTDAALRVYAQTRFLVLLNAVRLGLIASLIYWSLSRFDLIGAVVLTVAAIALTKVLGLLRVARVMEVSPRALVPWSSVGRIVLATLIAAGVARMALASVSWPALPSLLLAAGLYAGVYLLLLSMFGVMTVTTSYVWHCGHRQSE
jgi:O-antigen/teichoic acid export membrane protein